MAPADARPPPPPPSDHLLPSTPCPSTFPNTFPTNGQARELFLPQTPKPTATNDDTTPTTPGSKHDLQLDSAHPQDRLWWRVQTGWVAPDLVILRCLSTPPLPQRAARRGSIYQQPHRRSSSRNRVATCQRTKRLHAQQVNQVPLRADHHGIQPNPVSAMELIANEPIASSTAAKAICARRD